MTASSPLKLVLAGALGGLAWAASIRAYMVEIAGMSSRFEWVGTFAQILLPGVAIGVLLGTAEYFRRTGGRRGWRWLAVAPILFAIAALLSPGAVEALVTTGLGGGALVVPITGMLGGFAVSGRGPLWARIVTGVLALAVVVAGPIGQLVIAPSRLALTEPRGAWVALLLASLTVVLAFASSIPHRKVMVTTAR
jgi:hypothetical protein